jgi:hypothetical protein
MHLHSLILQRAHTKNNRRKTSQAAVERVPPRCSPRRKHEVGHQSLTESTVSNDQNAPTQLCASKPTCTQMQQNGLINVRAISPTRAARANACLFVPLDRVFL